ncbi:hypothetical protein BN2476_230362 [Paraburkholderia piptadeniae]|uniref:Uncharacterized protein n=1 Tax=Paraburkholderia piptadeniae TaxID=1701573 RepID=A0A1N7RY52_9BURK|nr:hypothetical protein BN2476_230362 [Paraburkholderia piptadeniae]
MPMRPNVQQLVLDSKQSGAEDGKTAGRCLIAGTDCVIPDNPLHAGKQSYTEITTQTTTEKEAAFAAAPGSAPFLSSSVDDGIEGAGFNDAWQTHRSLLGQ